LLHGGFGTGEMFGPVLPALAAQRRVIAVDLQAHGRTAGAGRRLRYETMADDVAALIGHLGLVRSDVMGVSMGGGVALRTAIQHPEAVDRVVLVSAPFRRDGWFPEIGAAMRQFTPEHDEAMKQSPMYATYARVAPRPGDWPVLHAKMGELLSADYDWSSQVAAITADHAGLRRQRLDPARAHGGVLRAARRRPAGRGLGRLGPASGAPGDPAGHHALRHLRLARAGGTGPRLPWGAHAGLMTCPGRARQAWRPGGAPAGTGARCG